MGLRISLRWGKNPEWFFEHPPHVQVQLIAEHRLSLETEKQRKERRIRYNDKRLEQKMKEHEEHHNNRPEREYENKKSP